MCYPIAIFLSRVVRILKTEVITLTQPRIMHLEDWIIIESQVFVREIYNRRFPQWRTFHNLHHTAGVADACKAMIEYYKIDAELAAALMIAAWFHDVGYCS